MITAADVLLGKMKPSDLSDDQLDGMPHDALAIMRSRFQDPASQSRLAPFEHQAFAREATKEQPLLAASILLATPIYYAAKLLHIMPKGDGVQTPASFNQVTRGFKGVGQGLGFLR